ncbi:MAG: ABC transporter permease [Anaerolineales bacterium]|nr:ABC transporter permease [Anaerolineales bacterium]
MLVELRYTIRRYQGQIIGWSIGLVLYSLLMVSMYSDIAAVDFDAFLDYYPEDMLAFFGDSFNAISSPHGYMDLYFFGYMTIIVGIFAVGAAAKLIVKDEEDGLLDLIMAYPKSRSAIFWGRVFGYILTIVLILIFAWLSWVIPSGSSGLNLAAGELLRPFWGLLGQLLLFGSFALLLSMLLPAARIASMITGGLLVGNYLMIGLANINQDLDNFVEYTPLQLYQGGYAILGIDGDKLMIVFGGVLLFLLLAWWRFLLRDLRVAGEGGWKLMEIFTIKKK